MMKIGILLIALGFGYKVFADASKEKGGLKKLGQVIGILVMIGSLAGVLSFGWYCAKGCGGYGKGYGWKSKGFCPFSGKRQMNPTAAAPVPSAPDS